MRDILTVGGFSVILALFSVAVVETLQVAELDRAAAKLTSTSRSHYRRLNCGDQPLWECMRYERP